MRGVQSLAASISEPNMLQSANMEECCPLGTPYRSPHDAVELHFVMIRFSGPTSTITLLFTEYIEISIQYASRAKNPTTVDGSGMMTTEAKFWLKAPECNIMSTT